MKVISETVMKYKGKLDLQKTMSCLRHQLNNLCQLLVQVLGLAQTGLDTTPVTKNDVPANCAEKTLWLTAGLVFGIFWDV